MDHPNVPQTGAPPSTAELLAGPAENETPDLAVLFGTPIFFGAWAVAGWWAVWGDPWLWSDYGLDPGPSVLPTIVLTLLSVGSLVMLGRALVVWRGGTGRASADLFRHLGTPAAFALSIVALVLVMFSTGFLLAALVFSAGWMLVLADRERPISWRRRLLEVAVSTGIGVGLITYLFVSLIHVPLP